VSTEYTAFCGLDVGKGTHHAVALAARGPVLVVVDQPAGRRGSGDR
jgi:hypothetical protein